MASMARTVSIAAIALAIGVSCAVPAWALEPTVSRDKWQPFVDFDGRLGTKRHVGEVDLFVPLAQDDRTLVFGDLRSRLDNSDNIEGNFGLGLRRMVGDGWNLGGYGFYDRRHSEFGNDFNQVTLGVEALGTDFDVRANGYLPFGRRVKTVDSLNTATISGASVIFPA